MVPIRMSAQSAVGIGARIIGELHRLEEIQPPHLSNLTAALEQAADAIDAAYGEGASQIIPSA